MRVLRSHGLGALRQRNVPDGHMRPLACRHRRCRRLVAAAIAAAAVAAAAVATAAALIVGGRHLREDGDRAARRQQHVERLHQHARRVGGRGALEREKHSVARLGRCTEPRLAQVRMVRAAQPRRHRTPEEAQW